MPDTTQTMAAPSATSERTLVNYSSDNGLGIIELTNAPANTYSYEMMSQLDAAIVKARFDESVHVIVLRGAGEKFFSAGADIGHAERGDANVQVLLLPARQ